MTDIKQKNITQNMPPKSAKFITSALLPKRLQDNVIGDMEEEFNELANKDIRQANLWYWQQSLQTCLIYMVRKLQSPTFLSLLNIILTLVLIFILLPLISLLSTMDDFTIISNTFWDDLLNGHVHTALFTQGFWFNAVDFFEALDLGMLFSFPSIVFSAVSLGLLTFLSRKPHFSALKAAAIGYSLMLLPYVWGLTYIATTAVGPKQIGPILAFMLIVPLYMAVPVSIIVRKKLRRTHLQ